MPWISNVNPNEVILSTWGNTVRDHVINTFASTAERDAAFTAPPNGVMCVTLDTNQVWQRVAGAWVGRGAGQLMGSNFNTADVPMFPNTGFLLSVDFVAQAGHRYFAYADLQLGVSSGNGGVNVIMRLDNVTEIALRTTSWGLAGLIGPCVPISAVVTPGAGPHGINILGSASASGIFFQDGLLTVIDVGM